MTLVETVIGKFGEKVENLVRPRFIEATRISSYPFRSTDMRDIYGTILKHWLGMPQNSILGNVLALDTGDPNERWTT